MVRSIVPGRKLVALAALPGMVLLAAVGQTQATSGEKMSPADVVRKVERAGYTNVHDLEYDDGRWELEAISPAGVNVDLAVDPTTGEIVHEEND